MNLQDKIYEEFIQQDPQNTNYGEEYSKLIKLEKTFEQELPTELKEKFACLVDTNDKFLVKRDEELINFIFDTLKSLITIRDYIPKNKNKYDEDTPYTIDPFPDFVDMKIR